MDLSIGGRPKEGDELTRAFFNVADSLKENSQDPDEVSVYELIKGEDIAMVIGWLKKWDENFKQDPREFGPKAERKLLSKYTFEQFHELYLNQGQDPYEESRFMQLAEDKKYVSLEEALNLLELDWRRWVAKGKMVFKIMPDKFQSEKVVHKIIGWCPEPLKV